jgi:signal transduction histidine kinase
VRIRTRLFLLIALLVMALVGVQWWLGARQIEASRRDMVVVATTVCHSLVAELEEPAGGSARVTEGEHPVESLVTATTDCERTRVERYKVTGLGPDNGGDRVLMLAGPDGQRCIPIPVAAPTDRARASLQRALVLSSGLLVAGLLAAAVIAHRVTEPLRSLASGVEAIGGGAFDTRVASSGGGEVGELQRGFNTMAEHLAKLEAEREQWRSREHLAQLGDLARGLAHTLRNPLNTLGLAVEELAEKNGRADMGLVDTARAQIRRVDRWLVSFLALAAGHGVEQEVVDLAAVAGEAVLEAVQSGASVTLEAPAGPVPVCVVAAALRAALGNLVENAVQASPPGGGVEVSVRRDGRGASIGVADRGAGLAPEVRSRLFDPHVSTRPGGSGMGLFLARQLVEGGLGGRLELGDREGGGTEAVIALPMAKPSGVGSLS